MGCAKLAWSETGERKLWVPMRVNPIVKERALPIPTALGQGSEWNLPASFVTPKSWFLRESKHKSHLSLAEVVIKPCIIGQMPSMELESSLAGMCLCSSGSPKLCWPVRDSGSLSYMPMMVFFSHHRSMSFLHSTIPFCFFHHMLLIWSFSCVSKWVPWFTLGLGSLQATWRTERSDRSSWWICVGKWLTERWGSPLWGLQGNGLAMCDPTLQLRKLLRIGTVMAFIKFIFCFI